MQKNSILLIMMLLAPSVVTAMTTLFIKPSTTFPKARFASPCLTTFEVQATRAWAHNAYNDKGAVVPLLSFNGPEMLLNRQINPNLPFNDTSNVGYALFDATLKTNQFGAVFEKNFSNNVFISAATFFTNPQFSDIKIIPVVGFSCQRLSQDEIDRNTELKDYLEAFNQKLQSCSSSFDYKFLGPSYLTLGYAKNYQDLKRADFIDVSLQAGFLFPRFNFGTDRPRTAPLFLPIYDRKNIGFPIQGNVTIGFYDWLNMGSTALIIPFISNDVIIPLNPTVTNNVLLGQDNVLTTVKQDPLVYFNWYIEAEQLLPKLSMLLGISYAKQYKTQYVPCDIQNYPIATVNQSSLHKDWEILNLTFESEIDFASQDLKSYPRLKFIYILPVYGKSIYKTDLVAGQFAIDLFCDF